MSETRDVLPEPLADATGADPGLLDVAVQAARAAGAVALHGFRGPMQVRSKGGKDIVTQYDTAAEQVAVQVIRSHYPHHHILAEEGGALTSGEGEQRGRDAGTPTETVDTGTGLGLLWTVDPIDGTHNYAAQLPFWCVSVAVSTRQGIPLAGVVFDPVHDELFSAARGGGAFLNGTPMRVSATADLSEAFAASDIGYRPEVAGHMLFLAGWVQPRVKRWRLLGSAVLAMAYVAAGRFDVYFHLSLQPWDLGAASLLVQEAGGLVTDWQGKPLGAEGSDGIYTRSVLVSNGILHPRLMTMLNSGLKESEGRKRQI